MTSKAKKQQAELVQQQATPATESEGKIWFNADGKKVSEESMVAWIREAEKNKFLEPYQLIVGTDSHLHGRQFRFVSAVCIYKPGHGGNFFYSLSFQDRAMFRGNQKGRMFHEATLSVELGNWLMETVGITPIVHADVSPKGTSHFTSSFSDSIKGYIVASGFHCEIKPASFVANAVADKFSK